MYNLTNFHIHRHFSNVNTDNLLTMKVTVVSNMIYIMLKTDLYSINKRIRNLPSERNDDKVGILQQEFLATCSL